MAFLMNGKCSAVAEVDLARGTEFDRVRTEMTYLSGRYRAFSENPRDRRRRHRLSKVFFDLRIPTKKRESIHIKHAQSPFAKWRVYHESAAAPMRAACDFMHMWPRE